MDDGVAWQIKLTELCLELDDHGNPLPNLPDEELVAALILFARYNDNAKTERLQNKYTSIGLRLFNECLRRMA